MPERRFAVQGLKIGFEASRARLRANPADGERSVN